MDDGIFGISMLLRYQLHDMDFSLEIGRSNGGEWNEIRKDDLWSSQCERAWAYVCMRQAKVELIFYGIVQKLDVLTHSIQRAY